MPKSAGTSPMYLSIVPRYLASQAAIRDLERMLDLESQYLARGTTSLTIPGTCNRRFSYCSSELSRPEWPMIDFGGLWTSSHDEALQCIISAPALPPNPPICSRNIGTYWIRVAFPANSSFTDSVASPSLYASVHLDSNHISFSVSLLLFMFLIYVSVCDCFGHHG